MTKRRIVFLLLASAVIGLGLSAALPRPVKVAKKYTAAQIRHGEYLVNSIGGCNDCHSPKKMTPEGSVPDPARLLSGHPSNVPAPGVPADAMGENSWGFLGTADFTCYAGPWGISYASNLTPDTATGIGLWTEKTFISCIRNGKWWGNGRPLLPPMPWQNFSHLTNNDLRDIYAYLRTIRPVNNRVPDPVPPGKVFKH